MLLLLEKFLISFTVPPLTKFTYFFQSIIMEINKYLRTKTSI